MNDVRETLFAVMMLLCLESGEPSDLGLRPLNEGSPRKSWKDAGEDSVVCGQDVPFIFAAALEELGQCIGDLLAQKRGQYCGEEGGRR